MNWLCSLKGSWRPLYVTPKWLTLWRCLRGKLVTNTAYSSCLPTETHFCYRSATVECFSYSFVPLWFTVPYDKGCLTIILRTRDSKNHYVYFLKLTNRLQSVFGDFNETLHYDLTRGKSYLVSKASSTLLLSMLLKLTYDKDHDFIFKKWIFGRSEAQFLCTCRNSVNSTFGPKSAVAVDDSRNSCLSAFSSGQIFDTTVRFSNRDVLKETFQRTFSWEDILANVFHQLFGYFPLFCSTA